MSQGQLAAEENCLNVPQFVGVLLEEVSQPILRVDQLNAQRMMRRSGLDVVMAEPLARQIASVNAVK